ncbi:MAG: DUF2997 domain-containing protein [Planctomycetota bacterium]|jgi:glutathionylspermidine synthase
MKRIEITIAPDGSSTVETKGFTGSTCRAASQWLERALGKTATEQLTHEFHAATETQQVQRQQNCGGHD